ncbi:MAG: DUF167 domain-containing protein [bacterium]|nr:DUF167 domain-containing protein [bacterium]
MNISVKVITRSKQEKISLEKDGSYKVWLRVPAEKGKANKKLIELLSDFFKAPRGKIEILRGETSSKKIIKIG